MLAFGVRICRILGTFSAVGWDAPPFHFYPTKSSCSSQSRQATLTALVARMLIPQQGQAYLRLLDFFGVIPTKPVPLWEPVPVIWKPVNSLRFRRISVRSYFRITSRSSSLGLVIVQPYLSWWSTIRPSEIATTKSLVVASSVQVAPERILLVGVHPQPPRSALRAGYLP